MGTVDSNGNRIATEATDADNDNVSTAQRAVSRGWSLDALGFGRHGRDAGDASAGKSDNTDGDGDSDQFDSEADGDAAGVFPAEDVDSWLDSLVFESADDVGTHVVHTTAAHDTLVGVALLYGVDVSLVVRRRSPFRDSQKAGRLPRAPPQHHSPIAIVD